MPEQFNPSHGESGVEQEPETIEVLLDMPIDVGDENRTTATLVKSEPDGTETWEIQGQKFQTHRGVRLNQHERHERIAEVTIGGKTTSVYQKPDTAEFNPQLKAMRQHVQSLFSDAMAPHNPGMEDIIIEKCRTWAACIRAKIGGAIKNLMRS